MQLFFNRELSITAICNCLLVYSLYFVLALGHCLCKRYHKTSALQQCFSRCFSLVRAFSFIAFFVAATALASRMADYIPPLHLSS